MEEVRGSVALSQGGEGAKAERLDSNEIRKRRMERFALKRKFASLSSRVDRAHREACFQLIVKRCLQQRKFPCVPSQCLSEEDRAHIISQHRWKIREFMQKMGNKMLQDCLSARFQPVFGSPVDVNQFPQYPAIVKDPMDFGTMRTKLAEDQYTDLQDFLADAQLVLDNARRFNPPGSDVHVMANCLQDDLMKTLKDSVIRGRESVDCGTLKEIEQRRCELVGKSLIQLRNSIEEDLEFAKGHLQMIGRDAGQARYHANVICCSRATDDEHDDKLLAHVHALPEPAQRVVRCLMRAIAPKMDPSKMTSALAKKTAVSIVLQHTCAASDKQVSLASPISSGAAQPRAERSVPVRTPPADTSQFPAAAAEQQQPQPKNAAPQSSLTAAPATSGGAQEPVEAPTPLAKASVGIYTVQSLGTAGAHLEHSNPVSEQPVTAPTLRTAPGSGGSLPFAQAPAGNRKQPRAQKHALSASTSASNLPGPGAVLQDCGASPFESQPAGAGHDSKGSSAGDPASYVNSLVREAKLQWPAFPNGAGCRDSHIDVQGIRLRAARAYTCARAISDRMCTTFTAANHGQSWLPLVKAANQDLLDSVMSAKQHPVPDFGPSVLLQQFGQRKLPDFVRSDPAMSRPGQEHVEQRATDKIQQLVQASGAGDATNRKPSAENLGQVAIRVFSLPPSTVQVQRQASHLARGTGTEESPDSCTRELLFAPWQNHASSLMSELLGSVPKATSWAHREAPRATHLDRTLPAASGQEVKSPDPLTVKAESVECGSREVGVPAGGEVRSAGGVAPVASSDELHRSRIPMMSPVFEQPE